MTPEELDQIEQRARAAQSGRIDPRRVANVAYYSKATREHWSRSRADVLALVAEVRRLQKSKGGGT